jgi:hypothetical protein
MYILYMQHAYINLYICWLASWKNSYSLGIFYWWIPGFDRRQEHAYVTYQVFAQENAEVLRQAWPWRTTGLLQAMVNDIHKEGKSVIFEF